MAAGEGLTIGLAFVAGLASFLSPCVVPLIPTYLTYLAGSAAPTGARTLLNAVGFIAGFTAVFVALGLGAAGLGGLGALVAYHGLIRQLSAILVVVFGLHMAGVIEIPILYREVHVELGPGGPARGRGPAGASFGRSALMGMAFSFGWTPCVGPILASILAVAASAAASRAVWLLLAYSAGLAVPFLLAALFLAPFMAWIRGHGRILEIINRAAGALLVIVGVLLYFNYFARLEGLVGR